MSSSFALTACLSYSMHLAMHLLVFPVVSLRDTDSPTNVPTTVEYNNQTNSIVGILSYSAAFWFLLLTDLTADPATKWMSSVCNWTPQYIAVTIAACYEYNGNTFRNFYCKPDTRNMIERIIQEASFSIYLVSLLFLAYFPSVEKYSSHFTVSASFFFTVRMLLVLSDYRRSYSAKSVTYPDQTLLTMAVHNHYPTKLVAANTSRNDVWKLYGHEYDLSEFVQHHPGGVESIMLAANREDATALFQSYHAFNIRKAKAVLDKYRISKARSPEEEKQLQGSYPIGHHNDLLYEELVKRVSKKLLDNGIDPVKDRYASWTRYVLYAVCISSMVTSAYFHFKGYPIGSLSLGFWGSLLAAHIGHDGGHYAISRFPAVNDTLLWCMSFISNPIVWQHQHTYAHHSFTNENDNDPDLHHFNVLMRYNSFQKFLPQYKMQAFALYIFWAFGFTGNGELYLIVWRFIFERSMHGTVKWTDRKRWHRTVLLLSHMFAYPILNFVVPYYYHRNLVNAVVCGLIHMITAGFLFALVSQVGHVTEMALTRDPAEKSRAQIAKGSWAADQVETTNDFCPESTVMMFFGGNLGVQIEHHLFPCLNHCHLQMIQPIVEEACIEVGLSYKKYNGWTDAMTDTIAFLQKLACENVESLEELSSVTDKKVD